MTLGLPFEFVASAQLAAEAARPGAVWIPSGLVAKEELLETLAAALGAPEWFGRNWDALEDGLRELSWRDTPTTRLVHADLPLGDPAERSIYLEILTDAIAGHADEPGRLTVVFPDATANDVAAAAPGTDPD